MNKPATSEQFGIADCIQRLTSTHPRPICSKVDDRGHTRVRRLAIFALAILILIAGAILLPLPIPLGAPLLVIGATMLITVSPAFARFVSRGRARWPRLEHAMSWLEAKAPANLANILRKTRPEFFSPAE
jgi:O-antigen/teichoic acid export membrane protein